MGDRLLYWVIGTLIVVIVASVWADVHVRHKEDNRCTAKHGVLIEGKNREYCVAESAIIDIEEK